MAAWLVWMNLGTVWLITADDGTFWCHATRARWSVDPREISQVRGDAYGLFLVLVTPHRKIWVWAQLDDRTALLTAIRRANPSVEFNRYSDPKPC
jgi:hypothetical protein